MYAKWEPVAGYKPCASHLAIFICVLDHISQTQGEIVLLCNISSFQLALHFSHTLQYVILPFSCASHLNVVNVKGSNVSLWIRMRQRKELHCFNVQLLHSVRYILYKDLVTQS